MCSTKARYFASARIWAVASGWSSDRSRSVTTSNGSPRSIAPTFNLDGELLAGVAAAERLDPGLGRQVEQIGRDEQLDRAAHELVRANPVSSWTRALA
jgi:hypothetical protein